MRTLITTFPRMQEFEKMRDALHQMRLPFRILEPTPAFSRVGCPAIILDQETRAALASSSQSTGFLFSGWVEYCESCNSIPQTQPPSFPEDVFGTASVIIVAPCIADEKKIRLVAHTSKNMSPAFPYLNRITKNGNYNNENETFSFMDDYRMVTLYPMRISIAKADDIVDGWRMLEKFRCRINDVYSKRSAITPSYEMRKKPPALEIYKHLPKTNCRSCGHSTCMAFAMALWSGNANPSDCGLIFSEQFAHLKESYLEICASLGFIDTAAELIKP